MSFEHIKKELTEATSGLLMMSETDEPFEIYYKARHGDSHLDEESVRKLSGMPAQYPVEVVELSHFFRNQTRSLEDTPQSAARAKRFQQLQAKLQELLQGVKVFRIGETRITAFILGTTGAGEVAGLKTVVVET